MPARVDPREAEPQPPPPLARPAEPEPVAPEPEPAPADPEVTERLDTVFLPEEAEKPLILRYDPSLDPVIRLALASAREQDRGPEGLDHPRHPDPLNRFVRG